MVAIADKFGKASIDTDYAVATTVKTTRVAGATVLEAFDLSKYPDDTPVFFITYKKSINPTTGEAVITNQVSYKALVNTGANTLTNLIVAPGYTDLGNDIGDFIECIPTSFWENSLINGILTSILPNGKLKTDAVKEALNIQNIQPDWTPLGTLPSTILNNGNENFLFTIPGDMTSFLFNGQKVRGTRSTVVPTQVATFSGSNWLSNAAPNKMTFNNNFTLRATVKITGDTGAGNKYFFGRGDAGSTNAWGLYVEGNGRFGLFGANGGGSNTRQQYAHAKLSVGRTYRLTATWASGTLLLYVNGQLVLSRQNTGGTAPTTVGQSGSFAIGQLGDNTSTRIANCEISQVAVFDIVLSAAQINALDAQAIVGTETNLKSAWSLSGVLTDLNSVTPNTLTNNAAVAFVTGGGFTNAGATTNLDYGQIVSKPTFSGGNTTFKVQAPAGNMFPTISTPLSVLEYSAMNAPAGFPINNILQSGYSWFGVNNNAISPGNGDFNLDSSGACVMIYTPIDTTITVSVDIGLSSTSDFEFGVGIYDNAVSVAQYQPHAAAGSGSGRASERSFTRAIKIAAGYHTIAAKLGLSSSTAANIQPGAVNINVDLQVPIMA